MRFLSNTHTKMQIRTIRCNKIQNIHYINLLHSDISSSYTDRFVEIVLLAQLQKWDILLYSLGASYLWPCRAQHVYYYINYSCPGVTGGVEGPEVEASGVPSMARSSSLER